MIPKEEQQQFEVEAVDNNKEKEPQQPPTKEN